MLVYPDERQPIARLLQFVEYGERLAHDCAAAQARLVGTPKAARFLERQARQEAMHAKVFQAAILWLAPRQVGSCPLLPPLERYRTLLDAAMARGDLIESLLAEQVLLEGLGEAILERIEVGLEKRRAAFGFLRRMLLHQEQAHHDFGCRMLERAVAAGETSLETLRSLAPAYLALTDRMVETVADLFESIDEDPALYVLAAKATLPVWLTEKGGL
jgi:rubrerythrin